MPNHLDRKSIVWKNEACKYKYTMFGRLCAGSALGRLAGRKYAVAFLIALFVFVAGCGNAHTNTGEIGTTQSGQQASGQAEDALEAGAAGSGAVIPEGEEARGDREEATGETSAESAGDAMKENAKNSNGNSQENADTAMEKSKQEDLAAYGEVLEKYAGAKAQDRGYILYDFDQNGRDELVLTRNGRMEAVYALNGLKAVNGLENVLYQGDTHLYEDGWVSIYFSGKTYSSKIWYRLDGQAGLFLPVVEENAINTGHGANTRYYVFTVETARERFWKEYSAGGSYPGWALEWENEITGAEFQQRLSQGNSTGEAHGGFPGKELDLSEVVPVTEFQRDMD